MTDYGRIEPETIQVSPSVRRYLDALQEFGLMEGGDEEQRIGETGEKLLRALHHFLAGGEVSVEVVREGSPSEVENLDRILDDMQRDIRQFAPRMGIYCY